MKSSHTFMHNYVERKSRLDHIVSFPAFCCTVHCTCRLKLWLNYNFCFRPRRRDDVSILRFYFWTRCGGHWIFIRNIPFFPDAKGQSIAIFASVSYAHLLHDHGVQCSGRSSISRREAQYSTSNSSPPSRQSVWPVWPVWQPPVTDRQGGCGHHRQWGVYGCVLVVGIVLESKACPGFGVGWVVQYSNYAVFKLCKY